MCHGSCAGAPGVLPVLWVMSVIISLTVHILLASGSRMQSCFKMHLVSNFLLEEIEEDPPPPVTGRQMQKSCRIFAITLCHAEHHGGLSTPRHFLKGAHAGNR